VPAVERALATLDGDTRQPLHQDEEVQGIERLGEVGLEGGRPGRLSPVLRDQDDAGTWPPFSGDSARMARNSPVASRPGVVVSTTITSGITPMTVASAAPALATLMTSAPPAPSSRPTVSTVSTSSSTTRTRAPQIPTAIPPKLRATGER
jgi:hypothetical protein